MHHLLFVLTDVYEYHEVKQKGKKTKKSRKKIHKNAEEVADYVVEYLENEGFVAQQRFASGPSDWFEVGGRWSGELVKCRLNPLVWKAFEDKVGEKDLYNMATKKNVQKVEKLFKEYFPKLKMSCPLLRNTDFNHKRYPDDSQIVDKIIWNRIVKKKIENAQDDLYEDGILSIEDEPFSAGELKEKDVVGEKWITIIDYHD